MCVRLNLPSAASFHEKFCVDPLLNAEEQVLWNSEEQMKLKNVDEHWIEDHKKTGLTFTIRHQKNGWSFVWFLSNLGLESVLGLEQKTVDFIGVEK